MSITSMYNGTERVHFSIRRLYPPIEQKPRDNSSWMSNGNSEATHTEAKTTTYFVQTVRRTLELERVRTEEHDNQASEKRLFTTY